MHSDIKNFIFASGVPVLCAASGTKSCIPCLNGVQVETSGRGLHEDCAPQSQHCAGVSQGRHSHQTRSSQPQTQGKPPHLTSKPVGAQPELYTNVCKHTNVEEIAVENMQVAP
jgi:hypothetical protein